MTDPLHTSKPDPADLRPTAAHPREPSSPSDTDADDVEDEEAEDDDGMPVDGDTLAPGLHFFEVATAVPCKPDVIVAGLATIGIERIRMDVSRPRSSANLAVREHRFLGEVTRALMLHQRDVMQWESATPLAIDVSTDVRQFRQKLEAFELEPGTTYEGVFLARERSQPTRAIVEEHLNEMGFIAHHLMALARDVRLDARPNVSVAIWLGLLEWDGPASVVTESDPFYFERLVAVG